MSVQTTLKWALRFYQGTDAPDGATQQANLAADVERSLPQSGTLANRATITGTALRAGLIYMATDQTPVLFSMYDGAAWQDMPFGPGVPLGGSIDYAGSTDPSDSRFLLEDGRALARTGQYAPLFALIGTTFGAGDGSTTFNIPDSRGRVAVGPDNMGTAQGAASRIPNSLRGLGQAAGEERHAQTLAELAAHSHNYTGVWTPAGNNIQVTSLGMATPGNTAPVASTTSGSGTPFNVMQPYVVKNKIIRVK